MFNILLIFAFGFFALICIFFLQRAISWDYYFSKDGYDYYINLITSKRRAVYMREDYKNPPKPNLSWLQSVNEYDIIGLPKFHRKRWERTLHD